MGVRSWIKDPFSAMSHWFGAALGVVGLAALIEAGRASPGRMAALTIYGGTLILLFVCSALAHSIRGSARVQDHLTRLDCAAIFFLIAGTYTPVCIIALHGPLGAAILIAQWTLATIGAAVVLLGRGKSNLPRTVLYLCMGWMGLIAGIPVLHSLSPGAIAWLLAPTILAAGSGTIAGSGSVRIAPGDSTAAARSIASRRTDSSPTLSLCNAMCWPTPYGFSSGKRMRTCRKLPGVSSRQCRPDCSRWAPWYIPA